MQRKLNFVLTVIALCMHIVCSFSPEDNSDLDYFTEFVFLPNGNNIAWPSKQIECLVISQGKCQPRDMIPTRLAFIGESAIITFPKFRKGVPFSLARMSLNDIDRCEPTLHPYPSWAQHSGDRCEPIINAVDLFLDPSNTLWVLDIGIVNTLETPEVLKPPKVVGIDIKNGKVRWSISLEALVVKESRLQFILAEISGNETILYISDAGARSVLVYNVYIPKGYRINLPKTFTRGAVKNDVLYLMIIFGCKYDTALYFTYLSSNEMSRVNTSRFRTGNTYGSIESLGPKPAKMVLLGTDNKENIFFRFQGESAIYVWNTDTELHESNFILVKRPDYNRTATHVVLGYRKLMWIVESNFNDYISKNIGCTGPSARILPLLKFCNNAV